MEISALANVVGNMLAPAIPYLLDASEKVTDGFLKKIGSDVWEKTTAIWESLKSKLTATASGREAVEALADDPKSEEDRELLIVHIRKLLKSDDDLASRLMALANDRVIQKISATKGSWIEDIVQQTDGGGQVRQTVEARDDSFIGRVDQRTNK